VALLTALAGDPTELVREAAGWALAVGHGQDAGARAAVEQAALREPSEWVRSALRRHLGGAP
jgi:hypothetical protein